MRRKSSIAILMSIVLLTSACGTVQQPQASRQDSDENQQNPAADHSMLTDSDIIGHTFSVGETQFTLTDEQTGTMELADGAITTPIYRTEFLTSNEPESYYGYGLIDKCPAGGYEDAEDEVELWVDCQQGIKFMVGDIYASDAENNQTITSMTSGFYLNKSAEGEILVTLYHRNDAYDMEQDYTLGDELIKQAKVNNGSVTIKQVD